MSVLLNYHVDSPTEKAGAVVASHRAETIRRRIHNLLSVKSMTDEELHAAYEAEYGRQSRTFFGNTMTRRRRELVRLGVIKDSGATRVGTSGVAVIVWTATELSY